VGSVIVLLMVVGLVAALAAGLFLYALAQGHRERNQAGALRAAIDDALAKGARERLAAALPQIDALADEELRQRLRVRICRKRSPTEGLASLAKPITERFEARVVLDGFELLGIPLSVRARFPEDDETLHRAALTATVADEPTSSGNRIEGHAWLCVPDRIFGAVPAMVACEGGSITWIVAREGTKSSALAKLANDAMEDGPMKGAMFAWDGTALRDVGMLEHTILGPNTPDYTLDIPPDLLERMGLTAEPDGSLGVRRAQ
jgi:hypothetical protein